MISQQDPLTLQGPSPRPCSVLPVGIYKDGCDIDMRTTNLKFSRASLSSFSLLKPCGKESCPNFGIRITKKAVICFLALCIFEIEMQLWTFICARVIVQSKINLGPMPLAMFLACPLSHKIRW